MTQIKAEVLLVSELFLRGSFIVPWHQRYYDWTSTEVKELLIDIDEAMEEARSSYFLGSIMLVPRNDIWEVNDGQQRLITLSLIFAALSRRFSEGPDQDTERVAICTRMLFNVSGAVVTGSRDRARDETRIDPPRQDRSQFGMIVRGREIGTNGKLTSAWNEIALFVRAMGSEKAKGYLEFLSERVEIAVLDVPVTEDANSIFEALNGRGKTLDDLDLIRNHLYSYFSDPADETRRVTMHERIESALSTLRPAGKRSSNKPQSYFRCFFQGEYGYLQATRFYRDTRAHIRSLAVRMRPGEYVYNLVERLTDSASVELFRTMTSTVPSPDLIDSFQRASKTTTSKRNLAAYLRELSPYTVTYSLLFALLRRFVQEQDGRRKRPLARLANKSIRNLTSFVMRVSFCAPKFEPSRLEPAIANCARRVSRAAAIDDLDITDDLHQMDDLGIMNDQRFIEHMSGVRFSDRRRAKRYLFGINARLQPDSSVLTVEGCTVEHVLPESSEHWPGWDGFASVGPDLTDWAMKLGNYTLLGQNDNRPGAKFNSSFAAKKPAFADSSFHITRDLATSHDNWTPDAIDGRSLFLAKVAAQVWAFAP